MSIYLGGLKRGEDGGGVKVGFYDTCTYRVRTSSEIKKSRVFRAVLLFFFQGFPRTIEAQNENNNVHNELFKTTL